MSNKVDPLMLGIQAISSATGQSIPVIYDAINAGHLDTFLVGRRRFAKPEAVTAWRDYLEAQSKAGKPVVYRARPAERRAVA